MKDIQSKEDIKVFVDNFYDKVKIDPILGPIFISHFGLDRWEGHLNKMYGFWNTVLFGIPDYRGNPFIKHNAMPLERRHFTRWLELFKEVMYSNFAGPKSEQAIHRAESISQIFQIKMNLNKEAIQ